MNRLLPIYGLLIIGLLVCPFMMWVIAPFIVISINDVLLTPLIVNVVIFLLYCMGYETAMEEIRSSAENSRLKVIK